MVVKRKTCNDGNTHRNPTVPRVQPLLKCARRSRPLDGLDAPRGLHTERSLQLDSSHHDRITQLVIHQQQPESQELLPALAPVRIQRRGRPHTAVKQDCRKVSHTSLVTIRPPASSCQLRRGSPHHVAQPLSTGWVHTRHWGVDDIAASCISRVATAACTEGGGASEGGTHSVEVQTELLPATPSSHSTPASLQLERTRS